MPNVNSRDILTFAAAMAGKQLVTLHRKRQFSVRVDGEKIIYTPESGIDRKHDLATLENICSEYNTTGSICPGEYEGTNTRNASYTLSLIKAFEKSQQTQTP